MRRFLAVCYAFLLLCASMYLGTGWSLLLFSFPIAPQLTVDTYYMQFVPQVEAATRFFTYMTMVMIALGLVMLAGEWRTRFRWVPIAVLLGIIAATLLTERVIFPLNVVMRDGIRDPGQLADVLGRWMTMNRVRVGIWTLQWAALVVYFTAQIRPADRTA